ncbi:MAG: RNA methyltransferase [Treponema sp.]|nr:RNA methyltransferase [Treponema sp.]
MQLRDVKIVLSRVTESGNAGAVCRVMKNMELDELRLAAPEPLILEKIYKRAVNSIDIWENARTYDTLAEAVSDCSVVIGTTRRRGQYRKSVSMTPRELAQFLSERQGQAAVVFGNERTGLEEKELEVCNFASHIPVSENQPSLNLSHAVLIYAYEIFLTMKKQQPVKGSWTAMNQADISALVGAITDVFAGIGFYKKPNREEQTRFLRDIISRAGMSDSEGKYFKDILIKAACKKK